MSETEPASSAQLKKEWLRREKEALAPLGFKHLKRDNYRISLGDDWAGEVGLYKRAATGPALQVDFEPPSAVLNHIPTQRLMRELYDLGPKDPDFIILPGGWHDVPSDASLASIASQRPTNLAEIDEAIRRAVRMIEEDVLPWMRPKTNLDEFGSALSVPQASPGSEVRRLERVAAFGYLRGAEQEARATLRTIREEYMPTGIPSIDEPQERFWQALWKRLDEM